MTTGLYCWSQTAATNSGASSAINWAESKIPSTVNDSARAMMAEIAKWRDDISGVTTSNTVLTTTGSANAHSLTTNGSISAAALTNGWTVTWKAGYSNTDAATLAVDGLAAKQIQLVSGTNLTGGEIVAGQVYTTTYHQPTDSWVLHGGGGASNNGLVKLTSGTVSNAAASAHVLTSYQGYRQLKFVLTGWQPATDEAHLYMRTST